ncbi:MAG TPA: ATP-dependent Clp protease proteolytic subunit [Methanosarcina sp.]|nr:ATP-dependent Clp protease proteolytic subunit [Methanosarcina sp.]
MLFGPKDIERVHVGSIERHFYINGPISDEEDYIDLIDSLYQGSPKETIYIHLNTPGGRLDIAMQILNAIKHSDCDIVGIADGEVASAGSLILFACPSIAVMPYSYVMLHDGSEGAGGKLNENLKQAQFSHRLLGKLYKEIYIPFFSEKEVEDVLEGKDIWVTSEEVKERITKLQEQVEQQPVEKKVRKNAKKQVQE